MERTEAQPRGVVRAAAGAAVLLMALVLSGCNRGDKVDAAARDRCEAEYGVGECVERNGDWVPLARATTTTSSTTTTSTTSTTAAPSATTAPSTTATTARLRYGQPCTRGSHRDCIDPEGDGSYTYLKGGAECMRTFRDNPGLCSDLDGDGEAGYPDSG